MSSDKPRPGAAPSPGPPGPAARKAGRWVRTRKWATRGFLALLALALLFRVSLVFIMPAVINRVASYYGLSCTYERMELTVLGTDCGLWYVSLSPKEGGEPLARMEYIRGDISTLALLTGKLHVWRAEAEGVRVRADRGKDGRMPLLDRLLAAAPSQQKQAAGPRSIALTPPLRIDALRLNNLTLAFHDASAEPPVESNVTLNLSMSDLNSPLRPTQFSVEVLADPIMDYLRIEGQASATTDVLEADLTVLMRGFHPQPAAGYLRAFGLEPRAQEVHLRLAGKVRIKVVDNGPATQPGQAQPSPAVTGDLALHDIAIVADGRESLGLDKLGLEISRLNGGLANCAALTIEGVRIAAERSPTGALRLAGVELQPSAAPPETPETQPAGSESAEVKPPASAAARFRWRLGELDLRNLTASFHDQAVTPAADLSLIVESLAIKNLDDRARGPDSAVELTGLCHAPGLAKDILIAGNLRPFKTPIDLHASLTAKSIHPDAIKPYLDRLGLESLIRDGSLTLSLDSDWTPGDAGAWTANMAIHQVELTDDQPLLKLDQIDVRKLTLDPAASRFGVDSVDIAGTSLGVQREPSGELRAMGFRTRPPVRSAAASTAPAPHAVPLRLPRLTVGRLTWKGLDLAWEDQTVRPAIVSHITDAGLELSGFSFDPVAQALPERPADFHAWLAAPGVLGSIDVKGQLRAAGGAASASLSVDAGDLHGRVLAPYLASAGIEPTLDHGSIALAMQADLKLADDRWNADLSIDHLRIADGGHELVGLDSLKVRDAALGANNLRIGSVDVVHPRLDVTREKSGTLALLGVRLLPPPAVSAGAPHDEAASLPALDASIGSLHVAKADIGLNDLAVSPALATRLAADMDLKDISLGHGQASGSLDASAKLSGIAEAIKAKGNLSITGRAPKAHLELQGDGLSPGPLAPYIPEGFEVAWRDGQFHAMLDLDSSLNPQGGYTGSLTASDVDLRDAGGSQPMLHADRAVLDLSRFDLLAGLLAFKQVAVAGLTSRVQRSPEGLWNIAGVTLRSGPETTLGAPTTQRGGPDEDLAQVLAARRKTAPLVTIDRLDIQSPSLSVLDLQRPAAAPLVLKNLHLWNTDKIECLGPHPSGRPAINLELSAEPTPAAGKLDVKLSAAPFDDEPRLEIGIDAAGINGAGVLAVLPELRGQIDGAGLTDGSFTAKLAVHAKLDRIHPWEFDMSRGGQFDMAVHDLEFRQTPGGPLLAGVKEVRGESIVANRGWKSVRIGSLEFGQLTAQAYRDAAGIHALGLAVPLPGGPAASQPAGKPVAVTPPAPLPTDSATPDAEPEHMVIVDHLIVSGFDGQFEDRTAKPPLLVPINGLELEVRNISNAPRALTGTTRFNLIVSAGKVSLPQRLRGLGIVGAVGDTMMLVSGHKIADTAPVMIEQDLFSQVTAVGQLRFNPTPGGWVKLSINGLDLRALHGEAAKFGVALDSGVLDVITDIRVREDGSLDTRTRVIFNDLELAEPSQGPIARHLALPAPLDAVIQMLEAPDGSITLPVNLTVHEAQLTRQQLTDAALGGLGSVILTAIASSPLKAVSGVGALVGLAQQPQQPAVKEKPIALNFAPGYTWLEGSDAQALAGLIARLRSDPKLQVTLRQALGSDDVASAGQRANPSRQDCINLAHDLSQRVMDLSRQRADIAGQAKAELASMASEQAQQTLGRLREADRELADAQDSLDGVYELLRPGAERQSTRRTRAAAIAIGQARLNFVRDALRDSGIPDIRQRVEVVAAQFNPGDQPGGSVIVTVVSVKHP